ncbi:AAA family ATPase [Amycolatopsis sp. WQ 127309]|uniref:AAA family ATPase n=1 Tax=Amycolatopsis sp. WQ 127309 TaxID=2932773 RepID=UPI001FF1AA48|nr:AAA family ATPase [Amycolatopsis sp. WQ 127309]UOZ02736.1 AAA family ATPase [Amycolatopsis sp. WQ 127309]
MDLRAADRLLDGGSVGRGGVLLVTGPLACGKTTVLRAIAEIADDRGFAVLSASCAHAERELQFGVVAQLFRAAGLTAGLLPPAGCAGDEHEGMPGLDEAEIVRWGNQLCARLIEAAGRTPLLIVVDDLRHADLASAICLAQLIRRVDQVAITVVVGDDLNLRPSYPPLRAELLHRPESGRIEVEPLAPDVVSDIMAKRFDGDPGDRCVTDFCKVSGGNPMLLQALLEDYGEVGDVRDEGYGRAFLNCLYRNEPILLAAARALAVLDSDVSDAELARVAGAEPALVAQALRAMNEGGLLHGGAFRHESARQSVLTEMPADVRADLHRRVAELLHDTGTPVVTVARHLMSAGPLDAAWSQDVLLEAADLASIAGNVGFAVDLLERALASCAPHARAGVEAKLAETEWRLDPATAARHLGSLVTAAGDGDLGVPESVAVVRQLLWRGRTAEAEDLLARLRQTPDIADELYSVDQWLTCTYPVLARRGIRPPADRGSAAAKAASLPRASGVLADVLVRGQSQEIKPRAEEVLRELHVTHRVTGQEEDGLLAVLALVYADHLDAADAWCDDLLREAGSRRLPVWRALFSACKAEIAVRRGDLSDAVNLANQAFSELSPGSWGSAVGLPLGCLILAYTRMGKFDEAARYVNQSIPAAGLQNRYGLHYLHARGNFSLATERRQAALADFLLCGELIDSWGLNGSGLVPWRTSAAEAWLSLGNRDQAKRLVNEQLARPGSDGDRSRALSLRLLAETSSARRRSQLLTEAIEVLEERGDKYELARALRDLSSACYAIGEHKQARRVMRRAWYVAKRCDAEPLCEELLPAGSDELAQATAAAERPGRVKLLTDTENRVASLAAMGYTNREIAGRLFVTASTVEQHLTRVFRKLGVKRREELPDGIGFWTA